MKRRGPRVELAVLRRFVDEVERRFLAPHIGPAQLGTPKRSEQLDVGAFVVLAHGAIENFVEGLGLWTLESVQRHWIFHKRASRSLASVLLHAGEPSDDYEQSLTMFDNIRTSIDSAKTTLSQSIEQNNGIAMQHLRKLFRPLGIDVPEEPKLVGALDQLVALRHQWAHQYRFGAKVTKFAVEVKQTSDDCLELAARLAERAKAARP